MIIAIVVFIQISLYLFSASQISTPSLFFLHRTTYTIVVLFGKVLTIKTTSRKYKENFG
jgi:hypothetical protein